MDSATTDSIPAGTSPGLTRSQDSKDDDQDIAFDYDLSHLDSSIAESEDSVCEICLRQFKGQRGVRIHQSKTSCGESLNRLLLNDTNNSQSGHDGNSVNHHNVHRKPSEFRDGDVLSKLVRQPIINWPKMSDLTAWTDFDEEAARNVNDLMHGTVEHKLQTYEKIVHAMAVECFGVKEASSRVLAPNRRSLRLQQLRKEKKALRRRMRTAPPHEIAGLNDLSDTLHAEILKISRAERACKRRRERRLGRRRFLRDPYRASKEILEPKSKAALNCSREELNRHLKDTYSAASSNTFIPWTGATQPDPPADPFFNSAPTFKELKTILKRTRNASSPGQNGLPYRMYKRCPRLLRTIWSLMCVVWRTRKVPIQWRVAEGVYIPKSTTADENTITDFRPISLLNVEAKMFFAISAKRLEKYLRSNNFIDTTIQKGGVCGQPGVWEHISTLWETIKDAKTCQKNLAVIWLDLANAFGSVPHGAISFALRWYHLPEPFVNLVENYYAGLYARFTINSQPSDWHRFSTGIFMGCTLSPILFITTFNLLNDFVSDLQVKQYHMKKVNFTIPVLKEYMDDITICTASEASAQLVLDRVNDFMKWSRMKIKPAKSRSLILERGKVKRAEPFHVDEMQIPGVHNKQVKFLGRIINGELNDKQARILLENSLVKWLQLLNRSTVTGVMKCWCYNHVLLPRIQWQLMIYDIPLSHVERFEIIISKHLRKWLGVSANLSSVALFCKQTKLVLPLDGPTSILKRTAVNSLMQLRQSTDAVVTSIKPDVRCGRKWIPAEAVDRAESRLSFDDMARGQIGRHGLGAVKYRRPLKEMTRQERRREVSRMVCKEHDEQYFIKAVQMGVQGRWSAWENAKQRNISWKNMMDISPRLLQFLIGSTYDTIASPANLTRWGLKDDNTCHLCGETMCTTSHILSGCPISLQQGRYTWRHNRVLRIIYEGVKHFISSVNPCPSLVQRAKSIDFVRQGEPVATKQKRSQSAGALTRGADWKVITDLDTKLVFPEEIFETQLRPDIVAWSSSTKTALIIELTVCDEANMMKAHERKTMKYEDLQLHCEERGWATSVYPVEVGCRGFASHSLLSTLRRLGITRISGNKLEKTACSIAERASFHIWLNRYNHTWALPSVT